MWFYNRWIMWITGELKWVYCTNPVAQGGIPIPSAGFPSLWRESIRTTVKWTSASNKFFLTLFLTVSFPTTRSSFYKGSEHESITTASLIHEYLLRTSPTSLTVFSLFGPRSKDFPGIVLLGEHTAIWWEKRVATLKSTLEGYTTN